jgi:hypothetical protein
LSYNYNPEAIDLFKQNPDKINWYYLSNNPGAIDLLEQKLDEINWYKLSENPTALLEQNSDKIDWEELSRNPAAIHLLEKNKDKIDWNSTKIWYNKAIFTYNYNKIKENKRDLNKEIIELYYKPENIDKWIHEIDE